MRLLLPALLVLVGCASDLSPDEFSLVTRFTPRDESLKFSEGATSWDDYGGSSDDGSSLSYDAEDLWTFGFDVTWYLKSKPVPVVKPREDYEQLTRMIAEALVNRLEEQHLLRRPVVLVGAEPKPEPEPTPEPNPGATGDPESDAEDEDAAHDHDHIGRLLAADWRVQVLVGMVLAFGLLTLFLCRKDIAAWVAAARGIWKPKKKE